MSFPQQDSCPFSRASIEAILEGTMGCYGLFRPDAWVYVGKGDIRDRLLAHLDGDNPCITREAPTHFVTVVCGQQQIDEAEKALIRECSPLCNQRVG